MVNLFVVVTMSRGILKNSKKLEYENKNILSKQLHLKIKIDYFSKWKKARKFI